MNQSELEANTVHVTSAKRGKTRASKSQLVWVLLLIGRESGARCFNQSQSEVKQNRSKTRITFDTQLKTALFSGLKVRSIIIIIIIIIIINIIIIIFYFYFILFFCYFVRKAPKALLVIYTLKYTTKATTPLTELTS